MIDINDIISRNVALISSHIKDGKCDKDVSKVIKKYFELDSIANTNFLEDVIESLSWIAENTEDARLVKLAVECYMLDEVIKAIYKYKGDVANEIFTNICWHVENFDPVTDSFYPDPEFVKKYIQWMNNGHISKLLDFTSEFSGNGNLKMRKDIFSILGVANKSLDKFDEFALKINGKKLSLEKRVELLLLLRDIVNVGRDDYAETLLTKGTKSLSEAIKGDLKIKPNDIASMRCCIKFLEDMKRDKNILFLFDRYKEYGNIKKWLFNDELTNSVIGKLKDAGFDTALYVASGRIIAQKRIDGDFSENWPEVLKSLVIKLVGSKKNKMLPKISIPNSSPGSLFKKIKYDYLSALNDDKDFGLKVLEELKDSIINGYKNRKIPKSVNEILNDITCLEKVIVYGGTATYKGAKVVAKVWKRKMPDDMYDSDDLRCCIFLPDGEKNEIPLFMMDPKATLVQFYIQGISGPVAIAFIYAGFLDNKPTIFIDTWEGGGLVYAALGHEKMKDFVHESILKFAKKCGASKVAFFAKPNYGRAKEFCNHLRSKGFKETDAYFEAVDSEDSVLSKYSLGEKHHYTDAFGCNPLRGKIPVFVIEV